MISARCDQIGIVDQQAAAFAGNDVLGFVKAEAAEIADRAERPALVAGHDALRRVFDDPQIVARGDRRQWHPSRRRRRHSAPERSPGFAA